MKQIFYYNSYRVDYQWSPVSLIVNVKLLYELKIFIKLEKLNNIKILMR
jgi:hypothetical protein